MQMLLVLILGGIAVAFILPRLRTKISQMETQLNSKELEGIKRLDKPLKTFTKISSFVTLAIIAIPIIFIAYLLVMFFFLPR